MNNKKLCDHPMFVIVGRKDASNGDIHNEVRCIMCDKEFNKEDRIEKNRWLETLYHNKRLLAKYYGLAVDKLPMFDYIDTYIKEMESPVEGMRNVYLEYYNEAQELIEKGYLPKDFSFEDSFFDSICTKEYYKYLNDKNLFEKEKIKTK